MTTTHSLTAERAVLGGVMLEVASPARLDLHPEQFFKRLHQLLWSLLAAKEARGEPTEMVAVAEEIVHSHPELKRELMYITCLPDDVPSTENLSHYAGIVRDRWHLREAVRATEEATEAGQRGDGEAARQLLTEAQGHYASIGARRDSWMSPDDQMLDYEQHLQTVNDETHSARTPIHLQTLRDVMGSFMGGDVVMIAGRPGHGKTSLAVDLLEYAASRGHTVGFVSIEMVRRKVTSKRIAWHTGYPSTTLHRGPVPREWFPHIRSAMADMSLLPFWLEPSSSQTPASIEQAIRRLHRRQPDIKLIGLDYIQMVEVDEDYQGQAQALLKRFANRLKTVAKELGVCLLVVAQLNRKVEETSDKIPMPYHLGGSDGLTRACDVFLGCMRPCTYKPEIHAEEEFVVAVGKNRNGPMRTGEDSLTVYFDGPTQRFRDEL